MLLNWIIGITCIIVYTIGVGLLIYTRLKKKKQTFNDLEIRFHKEANVFGEHGTLNVTHIKQGLVEATVRFVIVGLTTPPQLTKEVFNLIWDEARNQGYIPHHFVTYGRENEIVNSFPALIDNPVKPEIKVESIPVPFTPVAVSKQAGPMSMVWDSQEKKK